MDRNENANKCIIQRNMREIHGKSGIFPRYKVDLTCQRASSSSSATDRVAYAYNGRFPFSFPTLQNIALTQEVSVLSSSRLLYSWSAGWYI